MSLPWIFGPLVTRLIKRFGFRNTAISGCLIISISFCASSFVDNFWFFLVLFSVTGGLGSAMSYHCSVLVVLRHFVKWRSLAVGITASSSSVGMFVVTQLTEVLISNYGFKNALRGWAILFFLATPLAFSYDAKSDVTVGNVKRIEEGSEKNVEVIPAPSLLQNGRFIIYLVSVTPVFFVVYTLSIFLVSCDLTLLNIFIQITRSLILSLKTLSYNNYLEYGPWFPPRNIKGTIGTRGVRDNCRRHIPVSFVTIALIFSNPFTPLPLHHGLKTFYKTATLRLLKLENSYVTREDWRLGLEGVGWE